MCDVSNGRQQPTGVEGEGPPTLQGQPTSIVVCLVIWLLFWKFPGLTLRPRGIKVGKVVIQKQCS